MTLHDFAYTEPTAPFGALTPRHPRRLLAAGLRAASAVLTAWAQRLTAPAPRPTTERVLEFHCDASAPEGALFVNGERVGTLRGVTRL